MTYEVKFIERAGINDMTRAEIYRVLANVTNVSSERTSAKISSLRFAVSHIICGHLVCASLLFLDIDVRHQILIGI
jgi:hypothetical protein